MTAALLDLTPYTWHIERLHARSARLTIHCAPGFERHLRDRLRSEGHRHLHIEGRGTIRAIGLPTVAALVLALSEDPIVREAAEEILRHAPVRGWGGLDQTLDTMLYRLPQPERRD